MLRNLVALLFVLLPVFPTQAQETRRVDFQLNLDEPSQKTLQLEVSVRNHSFFVAPPSFIIIRPIISSVSKVIEIPSGQTGQNITIEGVSEEAVNYSILVRCLNCEGILPNQFYSLSNGVSSSARSLINSAYLKPEDLDSLPSLVLDTFVFVSGSVLLSPAQFGPRPARVKISLLESKSNSLVVDSLLLRVNANEPKGFQIDGLVRQSNASYEVLVECQACNPNRFLLEDQLDATQSHTELSIQLELAAPPLAGVTSILLDDE